MSKKFLKPKALLRMIADKLEPKEATALIGKMSCFIEKDKGLIPFSHLKKHTTPMFYRYVIENSCQTHCIICNSKLYFNKMICRDCIN
jgi:hypothetical protein